ncbi:stress response translation initiation inhibitor YciH [Zhongshania aquimaris]|uniref:Stress response translation initiation inhibitor YciH n=1 Tax=Zhongshania aquimaris TaxID=2857107 RepID=A0ABS6VVH4_9GAMM|nr:stress response translation initiation inhibitor YciH [Zhongshania aquimaris]
MSRLVYSTDIGRRCPDCGHANTECSCKNTDNAAPSGDGIVRIRRETKGRKGKGVSIASGILLSTAELKTLGKELRQKLSTGGAIKDGELEFQGDHRLALKTLLEAKGYTVKLSGA